MQESSHWIRKHIISFFNEPDEISLDTVFRDEIDGFSSMEGFSLIVMMEDEYGVKVSVEEFLECKTIGDLYKKCVKE